MNPGFGALFDFATIRIGGLTMTAYQVGAVVLSVVLAGVAIFTLLALLNMDMIAWYNERGKRKARFARSKARFAARKAHMSRVARYQAYLDQECE